jgi:hypothetical protein
MVDGITAMKQPCADALTKPSPSQSPVGDDQHRTAMPPKTDGYRRNRSRAERFSGEVERTLAIREKNSKGQSNPTNQEMNSPAKILVVDDTPRNVKCSLI